MRRDELQEYLSKRLVVITKKDEASGELIFDRLALSAEPDGMRRSTSVSASKPGVSQRELA